MNPIELGKFIASLRNEKNLTQEELAEKLFIDKRKISRWECGTSIPEFDMLIKLSDILDVSLYELSICKRIENESLTRRTINKFKNIKDFKKYQTKKKIKIIILIIFFILFIITASYTIKHNGTVEIYKLDSLDENYYIEGNYISAKDFNLFYVKKVFINSTNNEQTLLNSKECEYEIYNDEGRIFHILSDNEKKKDLNHWKPYYEIKNNEKKNMVVNLQINCTKKDYKAEAYSFKVKLIKTYDNNIF